MIIWNSAFQTRPRVPNGASLLVHPPVLVVVVVVVVGVVVVVVVVVMVVVVALTAERLRSVLGPSSPFTPVQPGVEPA